MVALHIRFCRMRRKEARPRRTSSLLKGSRALSNRGSVNTFRALLSANEFRVDSSPAQDLTHRANALWLLTLVALFGLVTGCGGNSTKPPATIAFESSRALDGSDAVTGAGNIWLVKSDGSGATPLTKLTAGGAPDFDVVWSPDGSKLAFRAFSALVASHSAKLNKTFN